MRIDREDLNRIIESTDVDEIRGFLNNCLLWNSEDINTIKKCVEKFSNLKGVFVSHNGEVFSKDRSKFTRDYLSDVNTELMFNFSKERYLYALEVANYLEMMESESEGHNNISKINSIEKESKPVMENTNTYKEQSKKKTKNQSSLAVKGVIAGLIIVLVMILIKIVK